MNKLDFLKCSKLEQTIYLVEIQLKEYVLTEQYEKAEKLKQFLVKYQRKDFSLDDSIDLQDYIDILIIVFGR